MSTDILPLTGILPTSTTSDNKTMVLSSITAVIVIALTFRHFVGGMFGSTIFLKAESHTTQSLGK